MEENRGSTSLPEPSHSPARTFADQIDPQLLNQFLRLQVDALKRQQLQEVDREQAAKARAQVFQKLARPFQLAVLLLLVTAVIWFLRRGGVSPRLQTPLHNWLEHLHPVSKAAHTPALTLPLISLPFGALIHDLPPRETLEWLGAIPVTLASVLGLRAGTYKMWSNVAVVAVGGLVAAALLLFAMVADPLWPAASSWPTHRYWLLFFLTVTAGVLIVRRLGEAARALGRTASIRNQPALILSSLDLRILPANVRKGAQTLIEALATVVWSLRCPWLKPLTLVMFSLLPLLAVVAVVLDAVAITTSATPSHSASVLDVLIELCLLATLLWVVWAAIVLPATLRVVYLTIFICLMVAFFLQLEYPVLTLSTILAVSVPVAVWQSRSDFQLQNVEQPAAMKPIADRAGDLVSEPPRATEIGRSAVSVATSNVRGVPLPRWTLVWLAIGALVCQLGAIFYALQFVVSTDSESRVGSAVLFVILELITAINVLSAIGVARGTVWGWVLATVAAFIWFLTLIGLPITVAIMGGLLGSYRRQRAIRLSAAPSG